MKNHRVAATRQQREADHFTELYSESGHTWWGNLTAAGQRRNDRRLGLLKQHFAIGPQTRILEVGCGAGEYTRRLASLGCPVTAIDITPVLVEECRRRAPQDNVKCLIMDATEPDLPPESFDIIFGKSILHHIDFQKAFKAYRRLLVPGGSIFFSEPNLYNPLTFVGLRNPWLRRKMEFSDDEIAFTRRQLNKELLQAGYEQIEVAHFDFLFPNIPDSLMETVDRVGCLLERVPVIKTLSGSLLIIAQAPKNA
jgi:2-polyprenyl-3-methyl-5-hydroxy-6-metoxy-1,4-benzoquinol methylase